MHRNLGRLVVDLAAGVDGGDGHDCGRSIGGRKPGKGRLGAGDAAGRQGDRDGVPATQKLSLTVALQPRDPEGLQALGHAGLDAGLA